jgi:hypothetical protein
MNMTRAYIRFATPEDQAQGFYLLMLNTRVDSYADIFAVPAETLSLLNERHIAYSEVPHEEVVQALEKVRQRWKQLMNEDRRPKKSKKTNRRK